MNSELLLRSNVHARSFLSSQIEGFLLHGTHVVAYSILSPPKQYLPQQLKLAPQSLHARPIVVPRGLDLEIRNRTPDVPASVLVDAQALADMSVGQPITIRLVDQ